MFIGSFIHTVEIGTFSIFIVNAYKYKNRFYLHSRYCFDVFYYFEVFKITFSMVLNGYDSNGLKTPFSSSSSMQSFEVFKIMEKIEMNKRCAKGKQINAIHALFVQDFNLWSVCLFDRKCYTVMHLSHQCLYDFSILFCIFILFCHDKNI